MSSSSEAEGDRRVVPPYVSFKTLTRLIERVASEGVPNRIDRSYLAGMSGGYQSQILAALRSLALIDEDGHPTGELLRLAEHPDEVATYLNGQLQILYPKVVELGKVNGTLAQLERLFRDEYGVSGSTLQGAIRFYLEAAGFSGIPVSPHFRVPSRRSTNGTKKKAAPAPRATLSPTRGARSPADSPAAPAAPLSSHRVALSSGGTVVLSLSVDLFALTGEDRDFVFELIDRMRAYADRSAND